MYRQQYPMGGTDGEPEHRTIPEARRQGRQLEMLNLSTRTINCLHRAGIFTVEEVQIKNDEQLMNIRGFGEKTKNEIRTAIKELIN